MSLYFVPERIHFLRFPLANLVRDLAWRKVVDGLNSSMHGGLRGQLLSLGARRKNRTCQRQASADFKRSHFLHLLWREFRKSHLARGVRFIQLPGLIAIPMRFKNGAYAAEVRAFTGRNSHRFSRVKSNPPTVNFSHTGARDGE